MNLSVENQLMQQCLLDTQVLLTWLYVTPAIDTALNACLSVAVYVVLLEGSRLSELIDQLPLGSVTKLNMHALLALKSSPENAIVDDSQVPTSIVKIIQPPEQS